MRRPWPTDSSRNLGLVRVSAFYRCTSPASVSKYWCASRGFDRASSLTNCPVFLAKLRKRNLCVAELALDHAERVLDLGARLRLGLFDLARNLV